MAHHETSLDIRRHHEILGDIMRHHEILGDIMRHHEILGDIIRHHEIPYTRVNKRNSLLGAYWLLSACFFPGFAPG